MKNLLLLLIVTIIGCSKNKDPFQYVDFEKVDYNEFRLENLKQNLFTEINEDSTSFRYYIIDANKKYPTEIYLNSDNYNFGKLRDIYINLSGDSIFFYGKNVYKRASGSRLKTDIDDIYELYCKWYGEPDSIFVEPNRYRNLDIFESMYDTGVKTLDTSVTPSISFWKKDKFDLEFYKTYLKKKLNYDSLKVYNEGAYISYKMKGHSSELAKIKDSIRKSLTPNDLISIKVSNPKWVDVDLNLYQGCNTLFQIEYGKIKRKDLEEPRSISEIRFDIVISDSFNKELLKILNVTQQLEKPLREEKNGVYYNVTATNSKVFNRVYNSNWENSFETENARIYSKSNKIKAFADIKSVVFEDGEVLNSEK